MSLDLDLARERFESSTDFTIGLEEEFAIVDPATLELAHRFEDVYAACQEDEVLAESAAGELIASEVEIRSGRAESFAEAMALQRDRRARLFELVSEMGLDLAALVALHESARGLAESGDEQVAAELERLGLQTVTV